ncbi:MAG TPA: DUF5658 family protein [Bacilli bacterium]
MQKIPRIRNLLFFVLFASVIDSLLTDFGLRLGAIAETNPLMKMVYDHSPANFYFWKITITVLAFIFLYVLYRKHNITPVIYFAIYGCCLIYAAILVFHGVWLILYL